VQKKWVFGATHKNMRLLAGRVVPEQQAREAYTSLFCAAAAELLGGAEAA
jgi:hypothetical protein